MKKNYLKPRTRTVEIIEADMLLDISYVRPADPNDPNSDDTEARGDRGFEWGGSNAADPENAW